MASCIRLPKVRSKLWNNYLCPNLTVLQLARTHLLGAHLGIEKTKERVLQRFFWPGVHQEVEFYCHSCPDCQITAPKPAYRNPLISLPIIGTPFERVGMDIVGPLPKSARGHQYILVIVDYATWYPEAVPLRKTHGKRTLPLQQPCRDSQGNSY